MIGYGANKGIVPQATAEIFRRIQDNDDTSKTYEVTAQMVEIYNEKVQDLLIEPSKRPGNGLKIRESKISGVYIEGVTKVPVSSYEQIEAVMEKGNKHRSIGAHAMNATSSRAHTIIAIEFKQITQAAKVKTEKFSVINLVDLAGSEKAEQTGATGDRLKEGCAINKSLTTLGQVIKVLADKSNGKGSKEVVPYRNSALTRMLQNALGGNSKTLMICALSPASSNYEETLGTLRYADRAKSIKNKAIVNESETEKLIRELKEENDRLKKLVESGGIPSGSGEDSDEYKKLLEENQRQMEERDKTWAEKLKEAEEKSKGEEKKLNLSVPHITNLSEDPQLDKMVAYDVSSEEKVYVGRKNGVPTPKIILGGTGIQKNHAFFENKGAIKLIPNSKEANGQIKVNGKDIGKGVSLNHNDRIVFGAGSVFLFRMPEELEDTSIDYEMAMDEVNSELKAFQEAKLDEQKKEDDEKLKEIERKYEEERKADEAKKLKELEEYEAKIKALENKIKKESEEDEIEKAEALKRKIEDDMKKKELEIEMAGKKLEEEREEQVKLLERKKKEHNRLDEVLNTLIPLVKEGNISAEELKKKFIFEPTIVQEIDDKPGMSPLEELKNSKSSVKVKVTNKEDGYHYFWDPEKFTNRLYMIRDIMDKFFETGEKPKLNKDEDPFWDPQDAVLIGRSYLYLKSLGYMLDNESSCKVMNTNIPGDLGKLTCNIRPTDETGEADECPEELIVDDPKELLGKRIDFNVIIDQAHDLPEMLCKDTYVKYNWYLDNEEFRTETCEGVDRNPKFNYKYHMTIDCVTEDLLKYFENDALSFKIYGTPTQEKFRKQLVMKEEKAKEEAKSKAKEDAKSKTKQVAASTPAPTQTKPIEKKTAKVETVKMITPDGQEVEVVKKGGC